MTEYSRPHVVLTLRTQTGEQFTRVVPLTLDTEYVDGHRSTEYQVGVKAKELYRDYAHSIGVWPYPRGDFFK